MSTETDLSDLPDLPEGADVAAALREHERAVRAGTVERPKLGWEDLLPQHVRAHVFRPGDELEVEDLEEHLPRPVRPRGDYTVYDANSFIRYVDRVATEDTTMWAQQRSTGAREPTITAVINDCSGPVDGGEEVRAGWRDHRVTLQVRPDPDWLQWEARDAGAAGAKDRWIDQVAFAEFLTDQLPNVIDPPAADLIGAITTFEAKRNVTFGSVVNLDTGEQQYNFVEQNQHSGGAVTVPNRITLRLRPFYGADLVELQVWLRHRITEGKLKFGLFRHRPDLAEELAWTTWCDHVAAELSDCPLMQGAPPAHLT